MCGARASRGRERLIGGRERIICWRRCREDVLKGCVWNTCFKESVIKMCFRESAWNTCFKKGVCISYLNISGTCHVVQWWCVSRRLLLWRTSGTWLKERAWNTYFTGRHVSGTGALIKVGLNVCFRNVWNTCFKLNDPNSCLKENVLSKCFNGSCLVVVLTRLKWCR